MNILIYFSQLLSLLPVALLVVPHEAIGQETGRFAGSEVCADCHVEEFSAWQDSHHQWAWLPATEYSVLGDFDDAEFSHQGITTRFFRKEGGFWIETDDVGNKRVSYEIKYTVGVEPLQQYLIETGGGRLQTLDIAWDTDAERWYMVFPEQQDNVPGNAIHWTGVYKNWNGRCAECHATGYQKGYDAAENRFDTQWAEIGVGCESCHGPAADHAAWADREKKAGNDIRAFLDRKEVSLPTYSVPETQQQEIAVCADCHSRRTSLSGNSPPHGAAFADYYDIAPLRPGLYFPDGQIRDEVYVLGSFYQSKMYAAGVRCTDCHNAHSTRIKAKDNGLCTQCHSPVGNSRFPQLTTSAYDSYDHMRHDPGTPGGQCINCHMATRTYMQVDPRRDHRFGIPAPQDTVDYGVPNACTDCHDDRTAEWAAQHLQDWRPKSPAPASPFGRLFHRLEVQPDHPDNATDLLALIEQQDLPEIVQATAIERLAPYAGSVDMTPLLKYASSASALERLATIRLLETTPDTAGLPVLANALTDPVRSVRIAAARALLRIPADQMPEAVRAPMQSAAQEFFATLENQADHPSGRLAMAGLALTFQRSDAAFSAIETALKIDPQLTDAWIMRARIEQAMRRPDLIEKTMSEALEAAPDAPELLHFFGNYLFGQRRHDEARRYLSRAYVLSDGAAIYGIDYARFLLDRQNHIKAIEILRRVLRVSTENADALVLLARTYDANGQTKERDETIDRLRGAAPYIELPRDLQEDSK